MLVSSATSGKDARRDLVGGDLAAAVVSLPVLLIFGLVLAAITGGWSYAVAALGLAYALYGVGLGLAGLLAVGAMVLLVVGPLYGFGIGSGLRRIATRDWTERA